MTRKELGKIKTVKIGLVGYNDAEFGIWFCLSFGCSEVQTSTAFWDYNKIKHNEGCKWTEEDRSRDCVEVVKYVSGLLEDADVLTVDQLKNIPIEAEFDGNLLKSFRILKEVL
jgi:hypothetical protein